MKRFASIAAAFLLSSCTLGEPLPDVSQESIRAAALKMVGAECHKLSAECDVEILRRPDHWVALVAPVSRNERGEKLYALHSGWNLVFKLDGAFVEDIGW